MLRATWARDVSESVGGVDGWYALSHEFYQLVWDDPILRPLYAGPNFDVLGSILGSYFVELFEGRPDYSLRRGFPRLDARHQAFPLTGQSRTRWLACMELALVNRSVPDDLRSAFMKWASGESRKYVNLEDA